LQTERQRQFRITWQLCVVIGVCLIALALPIASVILSLQSIAKGGRQEAQPPESSGSEVLENVLEGIADQRLAPGELNNSDAKIELVAVNVDAEKARIEALLKSINGIAVPTAESEVEVRLLVRVPADRLSDFLAACLRERARPHVATGDLFEIVIRKTGSQ
jgi:hypothetical protein